MKKLLSLTLIVLMLFSTLALTSCEDILGVIEGVFGKTTTTTTKKEEPKVRTTITEEEWNNAWSIKNYELSVNTDEISVYISSTSDFAKVKYGMSGYATEMVYDFKEGVMLFNSSVGYLGVKDEDIQNGMNDISLEGLGFFDRMPFSELTYDEAKKAYVCEEGITHYEFHFEDGDMVYAKMEPTDPNDKGLVEIKNIGTTVIEVGEYTIINDGKVENSTADKNVRTTVTSEELAAHLDLRNFTINAVLVDVGAVGEISLKSAENGAEIAVTTMYESMKQYVAIVDGNLYSVEKYGDGHLATSLGMTMAELEESISTIKPEINADYLTYDEEGRYYKIEMGDEAFYLYFEDGQLVKVVYVRADIYNIPAPDPSVPTPEPIVEYYEVVFVVSDIGTTTVTLPEYALNTGK